MIHLQERGSSDGLPESHYTHILRVLRLRGMAPSRKTLIIFLKISTIS